MRFLRIVPVLIAALACAPAKADLTWTLNGVTFADGGIATGTFTFLSDGTFNWDILTSGGDTSTFPAFEYIPANTPIMLESGRNITLFGPEFDVPLFGTIVTVSRFLELQLVSGSPTSGPANVALYVDPLTGSHECFNCNPYRVITAGSVDVSGSISAFTPNMPVPEPSLMSVFGVALLMLLKRRT